MTDADAIRESAARLHISPEALQNFLDAARPGAKPGLVRQLHATAKPIGALCNLDCEYCYYLSKQELLAQKTRRMQEDVLERFVREYIEAQDAREIAFTWHGGEPTLLGLAFFRRVVELQRAFCPPGRSVVNDLQTNGTLLDDEWCDFLAKEHFLVGISIDGPAELHDHYRPTKRREPSFTGVFEATQRLRRHDVPFSTLTTVNRKNALQPERVYRFLRDEVGARYMQFIPCVEPRGFERVAPSRLPAGQLAPASSPRARPGHPLSIVTDFSVEPEAWGDFLIGVFDSWRKDDQGKVKINLFESLFEQLCGRPSLLCTSSAFCGKNLAVEQDGRVYSCDHFVYPEYELGSLRERPLRELAFSLQQLEFGLDKHNSLPSECKSCDYLSLCWGECPRTRIVESVDGAGKLSYLCAGWKRFYAHALRRIGRAAPPAAPLHPASALVRSNRNPDEVNRR